LKPAYKKAAQDLGLSAPLFFDAPQEAVLYFADCVAQGDFVGALRASAGASVAAHYDLQAMIERARALSFGLTPRYPSAYANYITLNALDVTPAFQMYLFLVSLLVDPNLADGLPRALTDDNMLPITEDLSMSLEDFVAAFDPARLQGLTIERVFLYQPESLSSESYQKILSGNFKIYGYTDAKDLLAVYSLNGRLFTHTYMAVQYADGWQLFRLGSPLIPTDFSPGAATPVTEADVRELEQSGDYAPLYPAP
jgi:hypothetical protein